MSSTESPPDPNIKIQNVSNIQFKASRDTTSSLFSPRVASSLSSSDASSFRMFASLYDQLEHAPFGPTIDISFETMGEAFDFKGLKLDPTTSKLVFVDEYNQETKTRLPATTYTSTFVDSDGLANTVVATINPLDNEYMVRLMRENKPALVLQPFAFFKRGVANQPTLAAKIAAMPSSSHISYYTDELDRVESNDSSPCEASIPPTATSADINEVSEVLPATSSLKGPDDLVSRSLKGLFPFENCHGQGDKIFAFNSGIVVDYATIKYYQNVASYNAFLQQANTVNSIVYEAQFKIRWRVQEVRVVTTDSSEIMKWNVACQDMNTQLGSFETWVQSEGLSNRYAVWQLHTICPTSSSGTVGNGWVGSLCDSKYATSVSKVYLSSGAYTIAHEVGHNFGSKHAWDLVTGGRQGSVGGIMDYNTGGKLLASHPKSPNEYGFHEGSAQPICSKLKSVLTLQNIGPSTACFTEITDNMEPVCGNGIIEPGEECEVSTTEHPGSLSQCCQNCKLVKGATCSLDNQCCKDCQAQTPNTGCELPHTTATTGVCGYAGSTGCSEFYVNPCHKPSLRGCLIVCNTELVGGNAPEGTLCKLSNSDTTLTGICIKNVCQPASYEWKANLGAECDCSAATENVFRPVSYFCSNVAHRTPVASDICSDIPIPVETDNIDCNFICKGERSQAPPTPDGTDSDGTNPDGTDSDGTNPEGTDSDGTNPDGTDDSSDDASTSSALASSISYFIAIISMSGVVASLVF